MTDIIRFIIHNAAKTKSYTVEVNVPDLNRDIYISVDMAKQVLNQFVEAISYVEIYREKHKGD